jgi:DNA repair protein RecO (recombination protein O)
VKQQQITKAIVLSRTDYGEADRIVTFLTPTYGKLRLMARGVRKIKSKLAGGIELFSISDISFINGRGDLGTLISSRLDRHYGGIVKDIDRVQLGYDLIKELNKVTEDNPEPEYFHLMEQAFIALEVESIGIELIDLWFKAQMIKLAGHSPNLSHDDTGQKLQIKYAYNLDVDSMALVISETGRLKANQLKILRLIFGDYSPAALNRIKGIDSLTPDLHKTIDLIFTTYIKNNR